MLLGAVIVKPELFDGLADMVRPQHFVSAIHRRVWAGIEALQSSAAEVNLVTLRREMGRESPLDAEETRALAALVDGMPVVRDARPWALRVRDRARRRALVSLASEIEAEAGEDATETDSLLDATLSRLNKLAESGVPTAQRVGQVLKYAMADLEEFAKSDSGITGVPTGIYEFDRLLGGMQPGTLVVIAARTTRGKSTFLAQAARHAAGEGHRTLVFTLEMEPSQVGQRLLLSEGRVDRWALRGKGRDDAWGRVAWAFGKLNDLPLWFDGRESPTLTDIAAAARRLQASEGLSLLVVDYLQRCAVDRKQDRWVALGELTRGLKSIARQLKIPVLVAAQLNRQAVDQKPNLAHLREAGDIEHEADVIAFLHPHEQQGMTPEKVMEQEFPPVDLWVEKHRQGAQLIVPLTLERRFTRFAPRERDGAES